MRYFDFRKHCLGLQPTEGTICGLCFDGGWRRLGSSSTKSEDTFSGLLWIDAVGIGITNRSRDMTKFPGVRRYNDRDTAIKRGILRENTGH